MWPFKKKTPAYEVCDDCSLFEEEINPCAGWTFDADGNINCPTCGKIDPETGKKIAP